MGDLIYSIATWVLPLMLALVLSELVPAHVANMLGDRVAGERGRLSYNPLTYVDPIGTVGLPLILIVMHAPVLGWAKRIPIDVSRLRKPRVDLIIIALMRPATNLCLAALAAAALGLLNSGLGNTDPSALIYFAIRNLFNFLAINLFLMVFNLLPIPPFPGYQIAEAIWPPASFEHRARVQQYGLLIVVLLVFVLPMLSPDLDILGRVIGPFVSAMTELLLGSVGITG